MVTAILVLFIAFFGSSLACSTIWPNGTDTHVAWYQCNSGPIAFYNVTPFDATGKYEYPIHLSKELIVRSDINNPKDTYTSPALKQTTNIWSWTTSSCAWSSVPTFGMLKNLDACTNGIPCPVKPGRQTMDIIMDFSPYQAIINLLKDDAPYQLQMILLNSNVEVGCVTFQARARIQ